MPVGNKCCFMSCSSSRKRTPYLRFFRFPIKRPNICEQWVTNCANEKISNLPLVALIYKVVCELHFDDRFMPATRTGYLSPDAVPTNVNLIDIKTLSSNSVQTESSNSSWTRNKDGLDLANSDTLKKCCVRGCTTSGNNKRTDEYFFNFPDASKDDCYRYKRWAVFAPDVSIAGERRLICGKHFDITQFTNKNRNKLLPNAIPTLFPPPGKETDLSGHAYTVEESREERGAPTGPLKTTESYDNDDEPATVVEVLNEAQAQERIIKLMNEIDTLTGENVFLKKENVKLRGENEILESELNKWKACTKSILSKSNKNLNDEYLYHKKEMDAIKKQLKTTTEELEALKKEIEGYELHATSWAETHQDDVVEEIECGSVHDEEVKKVKLQEEIVLNGYVFENIDQDNSQFQKEVAEEYEFEETVLDDAEVLEEKMTQEYEFEETVLGDADVLEEEMIGDEEYEETVVEEAEVSQEEEMASEVVFDEATLDETINEAVISQVNNNAETIINGAQVEIIPQIVDIIGNWHQGFHSEDITQMK